MSYDYNNLNVGKLDYSSIRNNLVSFLKKYNQFSEYDFDNQASAVSLFIDILAANTAYNGYYLHSVLTNSFPVTATSKRSLLLNANLRGAFIADSVSARSTLTVKNTGSVVPALTPIAATQSNGVACYFYCLDSIPVTTGSNTVSVEVVSGKTVSQFSNFNSQTLSLELPLTYDPTAVKFSIKENDGITETFWTRVDRFSNSSGTNIFTVINGPGAYYVTTNIAGAATPNPSVTVYAIASNGTLGNSATINSVVGYPSVEIVSYTTPTGGRNSVSKEYLKTYVPYISSTNDRVITQTDYIDATYTFMLSKGISITKSTISVTSPSPGLVKIYIPDLPSTSAAADARSELINDYLAVRKMAGISLQYGA